MITPDRSLIGSIESGPNFRRIDLGKKAFPESSPSVRLMYALLGGITDTEARFQVRTLHQQYPGVHPRATPLDRGLVFPPKRDLIARPLMILAPTPFLQGRISRFRPLRVFAAKTPESPTPAMICNR